MANGRLEEWLSLNAGERYGRETILSSFDGLRSVLTIIDMQYYFLEKGYLATASEGQLIVPDINRLAETVRDRGGIVVWIQTAAELEAVAGWSFYRKLFSKTDWKARCEQLSEKHQGFQLRKELDLKRKMFLLRKTGLAPFKRVI